MKPKPRGAEQATKAETIASLLLLLINALRAVLLRRLAA